MGVGICSENPSPPCLTCRRSEHWHVGVSCHVWQFPCGRLRSYEIHHVLWPIQPQSTMSSSINFRLETTCHHTVIHDRSLWSSIENYYCALSSFMILWSHVGMTLSISLVCSFPQCLTLTTQMTEKTKQTKLLKLLERYPQHGVGMKV